MSRSGYSDDYGGGPTPPDFYQQAVKRSLQGKRGRAFLEEMARGLDAMPEKRLIAGDLVTPEGECCAMGVVCKARGLNVEQVDPHEAERVAELVNIAPAMVREIAYQNDDDFGEEKERRGKAETPEERWLRMRAWVAAQLGPSK